MDNHPDTSAKVRKWLWLRFAAGTFLESAFFMPAVTACNSPVIPARHVWGGCVDLLDSVGTTTFSYESLETAVGILFIAAPFFFGAALALAALCRIARVTRCHAVCSSLVFLLILATSLSFLGLVVTTAIDPERSMGWPKSVSDWALSMFYFGGPPLAIIHLLVTRSMRDGRYLCHAFLGGLFSFCWLLCWCISSLSDGSMLYGLPVALLGATGVFVSIIGEVSVVCSQSMLRTFGQLLAGRIHVPKERPGRCPACDYNLYGLTEQRCPECGRAFTFEELGVSAEELGFAGGAEGSATPQAVDALPCGSRLNS